MDLETNNVETPKAIKEKLTKEQMRKALIRLSIEQNYRALERLSKT